MVNPYCFRLCRLDGRPLLQARRVVKVLVLALLDQARRAVEAVQEALQGLYHTGL